MFLKIFKTLIRNIKRNKTYFFINTFGFSLGLAACLTILLVVKHELSFDKHHENADNIYRMNVDYITLDNVFNNSLSSARIVKELASENPEIKEYVRMYVTLDEVSIKQGVNHFVENNFFHVDENIFNVFSFISLYGDLTNSLDDPNTVVLTKTSAEKYFGKTNPIGKTLLLNGETDYTIVGVIEDLPENSHIHFDFLASFSSLEKEYESRLNGWLFNPFYSYVLLDENTNIADAEKKFTNSIQEKSNEQLKQYNLQLGVSLQALTDIHLNPQGNEREPGISSTQITIYAAIAVIILLIACINFINLTTATSSKRKKEIGIKKVLGADNRQVLSQFLIESVLQILFSFIVSLVILAGLLNMINSITDYTFTVSSLFQLELLLPILAGLISVGLLVGLYPANLILKSNTLQILKNKIVNSGGSKRKINLRRVLVVFQYAISVVLIFGTIIIYQQQEFINNKDLGFSKERVVVVPIRESELVEKFELIRNELVAENNIINVGVSNMVPGFGAYGSTVYRNNPEEKKIVKFLHVDENYIPTLNISVLAGRNFNPNLQSDKENAFIINSLAAKELGWQNADDAIGQTINWNDSEIEIIGVVEDFHFQSLRIQMQPLVLNYNSGNAKNLFVKTNSAEITSTTEIIEKLLLEFGMTSPFSYSVLADDINSLYKSDKTLGNVILAFSGLAIFIAALGLFGLITFTVERRKKEIGIRKVLGASVLQVVKTLTSEFLILVLISNMIAIPLSIYIIDKWLQTFAFSTTLGIEPFIYTSIIVFVIAAITLSSQAISASYANPTSSIRDE